MLFTINNFTFNTRIKKIIKSIKIRENIRYFSDSIKFLNLTIYASSISDFQ